MISLHLALAGWGELFSDILRLLSSLIVTLLLELLVGFIFLRINAKPLSLLKQVTAVNLLTTSSFALVNALLFYSPGTATPLFSTEQMLFFVIAELLIFSGEALLYFKMGGWTRKEAVIFSCMANTCSLVLGSWLLYRFFI